MTPDIIEYFNGSVPFGLPLIPFLGFLFTFIWWVVWRGTGFWGVRKFWRILVVGWIAIITGYSAYWSYRKPEPIPIRVFIRVGDFVGKNPGAWAEGIADGIRCRLRADTKHFVVLDEETAPAMYRVTNQEQLDSVAKLMRVKHQVTITQDSVGSGERPTVKIELRDWLGKEYKLLADLIVPNVSLSTSSAWAGEAVAQKFGGADLKGVWAGRHPNLPDSLLEVHYLAFSLRRQGEIDLASAFFMAEADDDTTWSAPRIEFARTRLNSNPNLHEEDIRNFLLEAAAIDRNNPESYILLGRHFLEFRDWDEAESALKLAYYFDSDDPRTCFYLSRLMENRLSDLSIKSSRGLIERALKLAPGFESARLGLVEKLRGVNLYREAVKVIEDGLVIDPNSRPLQITASAIYLELRQYQRAAHLCERILADEPRHYEALYNLGLSRLWLKEYDGAVALFDSSYNNGGTVENLYYCGVANQFKGDYPEAIGWFQKRFAAALNQHDEGAASARARIGMLRDWIIEDSLKKAGWKPENPFDKAPKAKEIRDGLLNNPDIEKK